MTHTKTQTLFLHWLTVNIIGRGWTGNFKASFWGVKMSESIFFSLNTFLHIIEKPKQQKPCWPYRHFKLINNSILVSLDKSSDEITFEKNRTLWVLQSCFSSCLCHLQCEMNNKFQWNIDTRVKYKHLSQFCICTFFVHCYFASSYL